MSRQTALQYNAVAKLLHWLMAAAIIFNLACGHVMQELPKGPFRGNVYDFHKQIGVALLILMLIRIVWRFSHPVPRMPASTSKLQIGLAHLVHFVLYLLMFGLPVSGIILSQAGGRAVAFLGMRLPDLVAKSEPLHEAAENCHALFGWAMVLLLAAHVVAALWHHYQMRDDILTRMLPSRR